MSTNTTAENRRKTKKSTPFPSARRARPDSPNRRSSPPPSAAAIVDGDLFLREFESPESSNPRSFPHSVKQQCWEKAEKIKGRHPDRWRRDALGNTLFRKLVGCPGCLCHDYDHIIPYSKGGKSTLENCQVLQKTPSVHCLKMLHYLATVNRSKGNRTEISKSELIRKSAYCRVSGIYILDAVIVIAKYHNCKCINSRVKEADSNRDMDFLELSSYGNIRRGQDSGGCKIQ
ncbi:hypothetical protein SASPL_125567 [Salvia splendens]|uniref:HNH domain-containing protein n=1 Tax=Salvia splendens TaxID=180675 RepID=A0A8X8ZQV2_SALSN|nr:hypothetical protein SASPL_125567 [Salvia splendens]